MSEEPNCREDFDLYEDADCLEESREFPQDIGCETELDCFWGSQGGIVPWQAPCALTEDATPASATRCDGQAGPLKRPTGGQQQPAFCVYFADGYADADGDAEPFFGKENTVAILGITNFEIEPCAPEGYCLVGYTPSIWLTRIFRKQYDGWQMFCNAIEKCESPPCDQLVRVPLAIQGDLNGAISLVHLSVADQPYCFGWSSMVFCGIAYCGHQATGTKLVSCIGDSHPIRARAVDRMFIDLDIYYGDACPYVDPTTRELINAAFHALDGHLDQLDSPGHSPYELYDSPNVSRWRHFETFGIPRAIEVSLSGTIDEQTFEISMDSTVIADYTAVPDDTIEDVIFQLVKSWNASTDPLKANIDASAFADYLLLIHQVSGETFEITLNTPGGGATFSQNTVEDGDPDPVVQGSADYYPAYTDEDIPIKLVGSATGAVYSSVATLTLQRVTVLIDLDPERQTDVVAARITAHVLVGLCLRVKRDEVARVIRVDVGGVIDEQTFQIKMDSTVIASYVAIEDDTDEDVISGLTQSWNDSEDPLREDITAAAYGSYLLLTHAVAGKSFKISLNTPGGGATFSRSIVAGGPLSWLTLGDTFDLRVEDPDNPGNIHPRERILAIAPNGGRVWRQPDDGSSEGAWVYWEGLKCSQVHSRGPNTFEEVANGQTCCDFLHALNNLVIFGRTNDNRGLDDRWKKTYCRIAGTLAGETFEIELGASGYPMEVIVSHTDTTGIIADTLDALANGWNASSNPWTADITATVSGSAVLLTADHLDVPRYDINLNTPGGDAEFSLDVEWFDVLPQYYEGNVVLRPGDTPASVGCG